MARTRWKDVCRIAAQDDAVLSPDIATASRESERPAPYNVDAVFRKLNVVAQATQDHQLLTDRTANGRLTRIYVPDA